MWWWLQPVELYTKRGLRGRIKEPVGTHGMLCSEPLLPIYYKIQAATHFRAKLIIYCFINDELAHSMILIVAHF
jgi:hypothetical protein